MKTKTQKQSDLKKIKEKIPDADITIFTTFSRAGEKGLSVAEMQELKRSLRSGGSEYLVAKKNLINIAVGKKENGADISQMDGSVGLILGKGDVYSIAKSAYEFSRKHQALKFFGALIKETYLNPESFLEMAKLPSKEILLGRLVGMLTYPVRGLAVVLNEVSKSKESNP